MEQINWSKAPEGATHRVARRVTSQQVWVKVCGSKFSAWAGDRGWVVATVPFDPRNFAVVDPRPSTWNGTGLPPVGTVCEVYDCTHEYTKRFNGQHVRIIAHHIDVDGDTVAVFAADDYEFHGLTERRFRPIRTPEQIAAEERERYITRMWSTIVTERGDDVAAQRKACADLYDAGLRFPEPK